jgi:hypothetical protein
MIDGMMFATWIFMAVRRSIRLEICVYWVTVLVCFFLVSSLFPLKRTPSRAPLHPPLFHMKPQALPTLFVLIGVAAATKPDHAAIAKRQSQSLSNPASSAPASVTQQTAPATGIPALASLTFGMPTAATPTVTAVAAPGAAAPVSGAPNLPNPACVLLFFFIRRVNCVDSSSKGRLSRANGQHKTSR